MSRILVTGASGFLGRRTLPLLCEAGHEVHAVARRPPAADGEVRWHAADLLADPAGVVRAVRPQVLVHLAWCTEHGAYWAAPENLAWLHASLELLQAFRAGDGERAVIAGTCAEYDWTTSAERLGEDAPIAPDTLYGAAKAALHLAASAYARQEGFALAWGRVFFPYGPDEDPGRLVASVARQLVAGEPAEVTEGRQVRDFLYADDVAAAFAALAGSPLEGPVNIGSGEPVSVREVVAAVARAAGAPDLVRFGARPARPGDPPRIVADASRLHAAGIRPAVALDEGAARCVAWWRERV
ncbi:MAG: NAD(P)-dependent oxidoreductase [Solirubrobacteraceae bacterium]|nr:NAD(P)-dependent oxidoreductase [Solirubrobacteraceae bacterium]